MAIIEGVNSGLLVDVDSNNQMKVALSSTSASAGFASMVGEHDAGTITGSKINREVDISSDYRLRVGSDALYFNENFSGSAINTTLWQVPVILSSASPASGFLVLNANSSVANGAMCMVRSIRTFPMYTSYGLFVESVVQFPQVPQANNVAEWGFGYASGSTLGAPSDGAFFRLNASGEFRCIVTNANVEVTSPPLNFSSIIGVATSVHTIVHINEDEVSFWVEDKIVAFLNRGQASSNVIGLTNQPVFFRVYNSGIPSLAQQIKVAFCNVSQADIIDEKPWMHKIASWGGGGYQGQTGQPLGSTALYTNNLVAGAGAVMTNTTAALGSGLGGQFTAIANATSGSSAIDGIISSYQVPLGNINMPQRSLYITGVWVQCAVTGSAVSGSQITGGPLLYAYTLNFGSNTVTLATAADALPATKAPRRIPLGFESIAANAASGTIGQGVIRSFQTPILVQPGEFVQVSAKNMSIFPTTLGIVTFLVGFDSYWE